MNHCGCGRFVSLAKPPYGWWCSGEFGEDTNFVCAKCLETWHPADGRGRGVDAGYCGIVVDAAPLPSPP